MYYLVCVCECGGGGMCVCECSCNCVHVETVRQFLKVSYLSSKVRLLLLHVNDSFPFFGTLGPLL